MSNTKISSKGQITIPKEIREKLNLKPGDRIVIEAREHDAIVRPLKKPSESMKGIGKKTKQKLGNITAVELTRKMREEDEEEL
ncbi:hypothetical protein DRO45_02100 [Candidatus Bathyarchaeota archaeon]|nr:AbrB/MazE/SpoVT family DNA-binding domain-containing protein [Candidatus Bathyarchaeota archaeon]RLI11347.1 MAG: hypothetical protein DRO25_02150 [Candidatus Bathyarchaeota archaeon]RLI16163.1 MAG: hypothetical protein DRO41_02610 [Candidatus Bathyarchaeota archaeon]RLI21598.1 MAG: hypothetical protein DRO45_02100 [Candidatus Bathyarchaeota archaeon]